MLRKNIFVKCSNLAPILHCMLNAQKWGYIFLREAISNSCGRHVTNCKPELFHIQCPEFIKQIFGWQPREHHYINNILSVPRESDGRFRRPLEDLIDEFRTPPKIWCQIQDTPRRSDARFKTPPEDLMFWVEIWSMMISVEACLPVQWGCKTMDTVHRALGDVGEGCCLGL